MENFDFTEDEIREQLEKLGYYNVSRDRLDLFRKDLAELVTSEKSRDSSLFTNEDSCNSDPDPSGGFQYIKHPSNHTVPSGTSSKPISQEAAGDDSQEFHHDATSSHHVSSNTNPAMSVQRREILADKYQLKSNAFHDPETATDQSQTSVLDTTQESCDVKVIKRKVLRKRDGQVQVCDESLTESDTGNELSWVNERFRHLNVLPRPLTAPSSQHPRLQQHRPHTVCDEPVYRLPDDYEGPTALIRPMSVEPHRQQVKKSDPVAKYQQYRSSWSKNRAPGEKKRKDLRWSVREHMLYQDEVAKKKQSKVYIPNDYVVPSDKKRKHLRWQIRHDLAQGVLPPSVFN